MNTKEVMCKACNGKGKVLVDSWSYNEKTKKNEKIGQHWEHCGTCYGKGTVRV